MALRQKEPKLFGFYIERTMKKIRQHLQKQFNDLEAGITVDQWVILDLLHRTDGLAQNEIADSTFKDAPTVTRIIDLLCQKNLTIREVHPDDRRRFRVSLTAAGREKVVALLPTVQAMRKQGWQGLTDEDYLHLIRILDTIYANYEATPNEEA